MSFKWKDFSLIKSQYKNENFIKKSINEFVIKYLCSLGFRNFLYPLIYGPSERVVREGKNNNIMSGIYNTRSGYIRIGEGTRISNECMFLTGIHLCKVNLKEKSEEVPSEGYDITIGKHCWIASGVTMIGGSSVADNSIVCTGAVVTKKFAEPGVVLAGIPARVIKKVSDK